MGEWEQTSWKINIVCMYIHVVMYILGLVFGVFAGLVAAAFSFIPSLNSPVYLVCNALVEVLWLFFIECDSSPAR